MSDQRRLEWEAFTAAQHAKGLCEFSGLRVGRCVVSVCDCFETPEGAAKIERQAAAQRELSEKVRQRGADPRSRDRRTDRG